MASEHAYFGNAEVAQKGLTVNPVLRFVDAFNRGDISGLEAAFHPDFEMVVPQHPRRGFKGRDQEVKNMSSLREQYPDGRITVHRMVENGAEVWMESGFEAAGIEMMAVVIFEIDQRTDTIRLGRYYSERVDRGGPDIDGFMESLRS